jgi:CheY-like chemotaxis protein/two-component sensor histidine kinase
MEEALIQSEKLKSIGTITAGISHEFNNILAIISGNVQLLEASHKNNEELMDVLRTIKRATNDGAQISRGMLKFTKTDKDTAEFAPFDINELINQAIDFTMPRWKSMAQAKGTNYHIDKKGMKKVPFIMCNPTELREVFINIINNAIDAMSEGGSLSSSTWDKDNTVFISISDTGKGMSEAVKKNIFDPFFTTRRPEGAGLGMSVSHGIIKKHGGKIEVESAVGRGSTFTLQFPAATNTDSSEEPPETKQEIKSGSLRILVVDDEEAICNILDNFLSIKGHLVRTVDNGREAIILAKNVDYDLVLCDMAMPEVYGYDVIRSLNELEERPKIGIITGWEDKLKPPEEEGLKVDFIIKKPFDFSELSRHINDVFNDC